MEIDNASLMLISNFLNILTVLILAIFLGFELINKVPSLLHTPLMSGSNAISGITIVGAILALGLSSRLAQGTAKYLVLGFAVAALIFAAINVAGGFMVTHRMLGKFKTAKRKDSGKAAKDE